MKKQTRFILLFVLAIALFIGAMTVAPLAAFADDGYTLTVNVVDPNGSLVSDYGSIKVNDGVAETVNTLSGIFSAGDTVNLEIAPKDGYTFKGWSEQIPAQKYKGKNKTLSYSMPEKNTTLYAVLEPEFFDIYYVGATDPELIPTEILEQYGTDFEFHPDYDQPATESHTFGAQTDLPTADVMNMETHTFVQWKAFNASGEEQTSWLEEDEGEVAIVADVSSDIYLVPQWMPKTVTVTRIDRITGTETELGQKEIEGVNYGKKITGSNFGEATNYDGYSFNDDETLYPIVEIKPNVTVVYRYYTPCTYEITFDFHAPDNSTVEPETKSVVYQEALPALSSTPTFTGYYFLGYYYGDVQYYDENGNAKVETWVLTESATLTAKWKIQTHTVTVKIEDGEGTDLSTAVQTLINNSNNPGAMDYGTEVTVQITVLSGQNKKLTMWRGNAIPHTISYTETFRIGEKDIQIQVQLLPVETTPAWTVHYAKETLEGIQPGNYQMISDGDAKTVTVEEGGTVSVSNLLGKSLQIIRLGTANQTADSEAQVIDLSPRPAAVDFQCTIASETKRARELQIEAPDGADGIYEVAYTTPEQTTPENWSPQLLLTDLEPGITYTIYLRVRATESAPHGIESEPQTFEFSYLVDLKPLFIILICLLALQILALVFLLVGRHRARANAFAAPLAAWLAIKLIPAGFLPWIIVLTIVVIALQVVLLFLSLRSSVVWKKKEKKDSDSVARPSPPPEFTLFGEQTIQTPKMSDTDWQDGQND